MALLSHSFETEGPGRAASLLSNLAGDNAENQAAIVRAGAVGPLLTLMRSGGSPLAAAARRAAIFALYHLASSADTLAAFDQSDNLRPLIGYTRSGEVFTDGSDNAAELLKLLAANSIEIKMDINRYGGVGRCNLDEDGRHCLPDGHDATYHLEITKFDIARGYLLAAWYMLRRARRNAIKLLTIAAAALLTYAYMVYSRNPTLWTARLWSALGRPMAKQVRRPEDRRRRKQAGAAAEATQFEADIDSLGLRTVVDGARAKRAEAAAEKAAAVAKARAAADANKAAQKAAEAAKAAIAAKAVAAAKAAAEKASEERVAAVVAANAAAAAVEVLERPASLPVMSLASAQFDTGRRAVPESTIGGQTTCIVCFVNPKSHAAVPCGHQCVCGDCAAKMNECPVCRASAREWMHVRVA